MAELRPCLPRGNSGGGVGVREVVLQHDAVPVVLGPGRTTLALSATRPKQETTL